MRKVLGIPQRFARAAGRLLLLVLSVTTLAPILHDAHVEPCEPLVVLHDETQHRFAAAPSDSDALPDQHCVACHFARISRGAVSWEPSGAHTLAEGGRLLHAESRPSSAPVSVALPARAPPPGV